MSVFQVRVDVRLHVGRRQSSYLNSPCRMSERMQPTIFQRVSLPSLSLCPSSKFKSSLLAECECQHHANQRGKRLRGANHSRGSPDIQGRGGVTGRLARPDNDQRARQHTSAVATILPRLRSHQTLRHTDRPGSFWPPRLTPPAASQTKLRRWRR